MLSAAERALTQAVSGERLMEHVRAIARWVRLSGTPEEEMAFHYVQGVLEGYGLTTRLLKHDAYISLPGPASLRLMAPERREIQCITHSFARPTPPGGVEGEVVAVDGPRPEDFARAGAAGRIALLDGLAGPAACQAATRAGCLGAIFVNPDEHIHEMIVSNVWGSPTHETVALLPRVVAVSVNRPDGDALRARLQEGAVRVRIAAQVDTRWRETPLLIADLQAAGEEKDDFVLFSGHLDSWHYGAMDNGSANATMLEVARLMAARRGGLRRSLRLAFWSGHSHGRYSGSTWYADHYWEELERHCVLHLNVDSTGGKGATVLSEASVMAETRGLAQSVIEAMTGEPFVGKRMSRFGDQSFWPIGIPALFVDLSEQSAAHSANLLAGALGTGGAPRRGAGLGWWWHTPDDTVDKIDPDNLVRDTRIYAVVVNRLLAGAVLPFDYSATAREFVALLEDLQAAAAGKFDLSQPLERARQLAEQAGKLHTVQDAVRVNRCLKALGRLLIPVGFTRSGRFDQDLALPVPPLPALDGVRRLAALREGSDEFLFLQTALVRGRNQVSWALGQALERVEACLAGGSPVSCC